MGSQRLAKKKKGIILLQKDTKSCPNFRFQSHQSPIWPHRTRVARFMPSPTFPALTTDQDFISPLLNNMHSHTWPLHSTNVEVEADPDTKRRSKVVCEPLWQCQVPLYPVLPVACLVSVARVIIHARCSIWVECSIERPTFGTSTHTRAKQTKWSLCYECFGSIIGNTSAVENVFWFLFLFFPILQDSWHACVTLVSNVKCQLLTWRLSCG